MLSHFVVAVASIVIAWTAILILSWHAARRIAEPVADIEVGAVTAWYWPAAAAIFQRKIATRLKLRRYRAVWVAFAVPLIEIVTMAARRRTALAAVTDFLDERGAAVQRRGRSSQLQCESQAGHAGGGAGNIFDRATDRQFKN